MITYMQMADNAQSFVRSLRKEGKSDSEIRTAGQKKQSVWCGEARGNVFLYGADFGRWLSAVEVEIKR